MMMADKITHWIFQYNRIAIVVLAVVILFLGAGIPRLQFSSDSRFFLGEDNQEYHKVLQIEDTYSVSDTLLLMVVPPEGRTFSPRNLHILRQMTEDAWQMPYALRVDSAANHMHSFSQGDEVFVEPMLDEFDDITDEAAKRFRKLSMASKDLRDTLLPQDGDAFGIAIRVVLPEGVKGAGGEIEAFLDTMRAGWAADYPDWKSYATGGILGNNLLSRVAIEDIQYLVPVALAAVIVLLAMALGSIIAVAATLTVLICATLATLGFAGWTNVVLTAGTAISPLAVMVLVSTSCVHVVLGTIRAAENGTRINPFRHSISNNLAPVTVSHLTTAFGFLCLNFAPSPPLADMGNIVAFGLLFGHVCVFVVLPALLKDRPLTTVGRFMVSGQTMKRLARWVLRNSRIWLFVFPIVSILAAFGVARISYDDNIIRYFDQRYEFRQDSEAILERLTGLDSIQFTFKAPEGTSVFQPGFLRSVDRFTTWLEVQPNVVSVGSLAEIIKDLNQSMNGDELEFYRVAPTQSANAQLLMFYELSLPVGMDLNVMMDVDRTQTLVTATVRAQHSDMIRALAQQAETWLVENEPQIATQAAGMTIAFARISERNNSQMLYGFLSVLCLVSLVLIVTLRSLKMGVISLVPNLLPALLAFGFWGLADGSVNLGSTVVTTMTFGIVVDDTVHFLMHYLRCRRRALDVQAALEDTFAVVGSSIMLTSVALVLGFSIMAASGFSINQHIGVLTAVVIVFALLSDLLFLPALLKAFQGKKK